MTGPAVPSAGSSSKVDPDVTLRIDTGARSVAAQPPITGAQPVADYLRANARFLAPLCRPAIVNGGAGIVVGPPGRVIGVVSIAVVCGRIRAMDIVADPSKLARVNGTAADVDEVAS